MLKYVNEIKYTRFRPGQIVSFPMMYVANIKTKFINNEEGILVNIKIGACKNCNITSRHANNK